jgi:hypothetical protein
MNFCNHCKGNGIAQSSNSFSENQTNKEASLSAKNDNRTKSKDNIEINSL